MMLLTRKTLLLLAVLGGLVVLNLADPGHTPSFGEAFPTLAPLPVDKARRIEVSTSAQKVTLRYDEAAEEWRVVAPYQAKADQARIKAFLALFARGIPLDVRLDTGNLEQYGLDASNGVVVELWTSDDDTAPAISYTAGFDGPGGSTFLRLSGDESVYRAQIGGRHIYEQPAIVWRNQVLLDFDYLDATGVSVVQQGRETLRLLRGTSPGLDGVSGVGAWELDPAAPWPVDQRTAESMVRQLGLLRAGAILAPGTPAGLEPPRAEILVTLASGEQRTLSVGDLRGKSGVIVKVEGNEDLYQTSAGFVELALQPPGAFRELALFALAAKDIDTFTLEEGTSRILLQQGEGGIWTVLQPQNMDVDIRRVYVGVNNFAELRAQAVSDRDLAQAGLLTPDARITARLYDGSEHTLEIGLPIETAAGKARFVRRGNSTVVYILPEEVVQKMKSAFSRL